MEITNGYLSRDLRTFRRHEYTSGYDRSDKSSVMNDSYFGMITSLRSSLPSPKAITESHLNEQQTLYIHPLENRRNCCSDL